MKRMFERLFQTKFRWMALLLVLTLLIGVGASLARKVMAEVRNGGTSNVEQRGENNDENDNEGENEGNEENDSDIAALVAQVKISFQQANDVALAANPGALVFETDLSDENGVTVYEITLQTEQSVFVEVKVDATTAQVLPEDAQNIEHEDGQESDSENGEQERSEDDD